MGVAMRQKVRILKDRKSFSERAEPSLLKQIAEIRKLRDQVRLAEAAKRRSQLMARLTG
jgi:hypothetical protein